MARMWPVVLPAWVLSDERRSVEVRVWRRLAETLDDSWSVYYSRPWWGLNEKGGEVDGETDFIVAGAASGFLFVEVKGGVVNWDPATSKWSSRDRFKVVRQIKDPVQQAVASKHRYLARLRSLPDWPSGYVRFRHGVILPDNDKPEAGKISIAGYAIQLFCFADEFDDRVDQWVRERLEAHDASGPVKEVPPGSTGLGLLNRLVADPVRLHVSLRREVQADIERIDQLLTGQQLHAIAVMESMPRLLIEGGAGTGKTLLAIEMAARLSDAGRKVCLLCYNEPLGEYLRARLSAYPNVYVGTFHKLCGMLAGEAGIDPGPVGPDFFEEELPRGAELALDRMPNRRWDAVIVDEGQDFSGHWWHLVNRLLSENGPRILRAFVDANQALYALPKGLTQTLGAQPLVLGINLRNTKAIARVTEPLYSGPLIKAVGPDGELPAAQLDPFSEGCSKVVALVARLLRDDRVVADDIAVLAPAELGVKRLRSMLDQLRIQSCTAADRRKNFVTLDTIRRFKGLESPIVLMLMDSAAASSRELAYVGVSRAQSRLYLFGELSGTLIADALEKARIAQGQTP